MLNPYIFYCIYLFISIICILVIKKQTKHTQTVYLFIGNCTMFNITYIVSNNNIWLVVVILIFEPLKWLILAQLLSKNIKLFHQNGCRNFFDILTERYFIYRKLIITLLILFYTIFIGINCKWLQIINYYYFYEYNQISLYLIIMLCILLRLYYPSIEYVLKNIVIGGLILIILLFICGLLNLNIDQFTNELPQEFLASDNTWQIIPFFIIYTQIFFLPIIINNLLHCNAMTVTKNILNTGIISTGMNIMFTIIALYTITTTPEVDHSSTLFDFSYKIFNDLSSIIGLIFIFFIIITIAEILKFIQISLQHLFFYNNTVSNLGIVTILTFIFPWIFLLDFKDFYLLFKVIEPFYYSTIAVPMTIILIRNYKNNHYITQICIVILIMLILLVFTQDYLIAEAGSILTALIIFGFYKKNYYKII